MPNKDGFPNLLAPARRALSAVGYTRPEQLAHASQLDLKELHRMGPAALHERGFTIRALSTESVLDASEAELGAPRC